MNYETKEIHQQGVVQKEPSLYQVLIHNDDFTPMEFVVSVLERIFFMDKERAQQVMLAAHTLGKASCGLYYKDIADTKVYQAMEHARDNEHPLLCSLELA